MPQIIQSTAGARAWDRGYGFHPLLCTLPWSWESFSHDTSQVSDNNAQDKQVFWKYIKNKLIKFSLMKSNINVWLIIRKASFYCKGGWILGQAAQRGQRISIFGDTQNPTGDGYKPTCSRQLCFELQCWTRWSTDVFSDHHYSVLF